MDGWKPKKTIWDYLKDVLGVMAVLLEGLAIAGIFYYALCH